LSSSQLAFAVLTSAKSASDPRKSVQELYINKAGYQAAWNAAVDALATKKLLLSDDVTEYKNRVQNQNAQTTFTLP
jgi:hypothetical protein